MIENTNFVFSLKFFFTKELKNNIPKEKNIRAVLWLLPQIAEYWKTGKINISEDKTKIIDLSKFSKRFFSTWYKIKGSKNEIINTETK